MPYFTVFEQTNKFLLFSLFFLQTINHSIFKKIDNKETFVEIYV
jgi:hypothetical protein